jgi:hypothetical protein
MASANDCRPNGRLPSEVRSLLAGPINSFEKLEVISALDRAPDKTMLKIDLAQQLQLDPDAMSRCLIELQRGGLLLVAADSTVRLVALPADHGLSELLRIYDEDRLVLVSALSAISMQRIQGMAARAFGDAFVTCKKPDDDDD